ncbi:DUF3130 family protein [Listeria monocytogenes]|nr:DUF3130 family protein [Listeria monocytogenes]
MKLQPVLLITNKIPYCVYFQQVTKQDANRLKKMGIAYAKQDQVMGQKIHQLELR